MKKADARRSSSALPPLTVDFLYQVLETELGGVQVYRAAIQSAVDARLRREWQQYLAQTEQHVQRARKLLQTVGLDPDADTPGRQVLRVIAAGLVQAMELARGGDDPRAAELVAAECVVQAETKDHANWSLLGRLLAEQPRGLPGELADAHAAVEPEEDEHLYHSMGWCRELWAQALGLAAVLPPPEEEHDVRSAKDAARAKELAEEG
jgi:hypothetical protein